MSYKETTIRSSHVYHSKGLIKNGQWANSSKLYPIENEAKEKPVITLVELGSTFKYHIYDCLDQLQHMSPTARIIFIVDNENTAFHLSFKKGIEVYMYDQSKDKRCQDVIANLGGGLFSLSLIRFFAIEHCMKELKLERCFHMEHDNLVYVDTSYVMSRCRVVYGNKLGITRDSVKRCIAGFMYIGSIESLHQLNNFFEKEQYSDAEMALMAQFMTKHPEYADNLPLTPGNYNTQSDLGRYVDKFKLVFDAAAVGQWIGGIDTIHSNKDTRGFVNETAEYKVQYGDLAFKWVLDEKGRRVPMLQYGTNYVRLVNLHIHSKQLHLYLSSSYLPSYEYIQGNKFKDLAGQVYHDKFEDPIHAKLIYVKTDRLDSFFNGPFKNLKHQIVLITHNADHTVHDGHKKYLDDHRIIAWYGQNVQTVHPKLYEIPIGIANSEWTHGDIGALQKVASKYHFKRNKMYANFNDATHADRKLFRDELKKHPTFAIQGDLVPFQEYLETLAKYEVSASPQGNGPDTHRRWESLYLGTTPITSNVNTRAIFTDKSIPQGDWQLGIGHALNHYKSWKEFSGRRQLRMSYWTARIHSHLKNTDEPFDAVIVTHPKDYDMIPQCLFGLQRNLGSLRDIYIVTPRKEKTDELDNLIRQEGIMSNRVHVIDEALHFDFAFKDISDRLGNSERAGWYLQQLLKLHVDTIPNISENILIVDSDTVFCRRVSFFEQGKPCYHLVPGMDEWYYRQHGARLFDLLGIDDMKEMYHGSTAVCHHMMFNGKILKEIRSHAKDKPFWQLFMQAVKPEFFKTSGASEYELYFQYVSNFHDFQVRPLKFINTGEKQEALDALKTEAYDFVSVHAYLRSS